MHCSIAIRRLSLSGTPPLVAVAAPGSPLVPEVLRDRCRSAPAQRQESTANCGFREGSRAERDHLPQVLPRPVQSIPHDSRKQAHLFLPELASSPNRFHRQESSPHIRLFQPTTPRCSPEPLYRASPPPQSCPSEVCGRTHFLAKGQAISLLNLAS